MLTRSPMICMRSLSAETTSTSAPAAACLLGIGGDEVIGLVAGHFHGDEPERLHRLAHERKLGDQFLGGSERLAL